MDEATRRNVAVRGLFRMGRARRRALRSLAPPALARLYDRLDRLQHEEPFPPEGLGVRTRLAAGWKMLDRLAGRRRLSSVSLAAARGEIDGLEDSIASWQAGTRMTTGRRAGSG